jgi:hypothetical protein
MNYSRLYDALIFNAKSQIRIKGCGVYYEKHHILPKCIGGDDSKNNLVLLTGREHFLAHWLLWKREIGLNKHKMAYAFFQMTRQTKLSTGRLIVSGKKYEIVKKAHAEAMSYIHTKRRFSDVTRNRMSDAKKGKCFGKKNNFYGKVHSEEQKKQWSLMASERKGEKNPNAKTWQIQFPDGNIYYIKSLKTFCDNLNVSVKHMRNNKIQGYTFIGEKSETLGT